MTTADYSLRYSGDGTGFLLIHGLGGTPVELRLVGRALLRAGHTVHCPQLAGHCGSEADLLATQWRDWADSVFAELDRMRANCDRIIVGGLSMGAVLAMHVAARRQADVDGLALYAPTLRYDGWSIPRYAFLLKWLINTPMGRHYSFAEREPYGIKHKRTRQAIGEAMASGDSSEAGLQGTPSRALQQMWQLVDETRRQMPTITCPTLLVHAREDDIAGLSNAFEIQRRLGGLVDVVILDDSYHLVTIDQQREILIERSLALAKRLAKGRTTKRLVPLRTAVAE
ncbi:alpha/beta hydrolase [Bosea psychrotolerans]|uniref:Esterase/lipase n=1 Tax=Bosea psychrotolerans TaxID=1871628 RepID=A0A2S4M914_9HYPH|nr:alpha/beta fold hydrolase [Bosea psychrotolerans]POR51222.1 esterase/lipase [Bosea psychrotolerans]